MIKLSQIRQLSARISRKVSTQITLAAVVTGATFLPGLAQAADQVTIARFEHRSVPIEAIEELAETGVADGFLYQVIDGIGEDPADAAKLLSTPMEYDLVAADKLFNSPAGEDLLSNLGQFIMPHCSGNEANKALRASIIESLADDGSMTIVEILKNYPVGVRVRMEELLTMGEHFTGLDQLISFMSSSEALEVSESVESQYSSLMQRRTVTQSTVRGESRIPDRPVAAPVRALW